MDVFPVLQKLTHMFSNTLVLIAGCLKLHKECKYQLIWSMLQNTHFVLLFWSEIFVCFISYAFSISKGKFTEHSGFRKKPENLKLCEDILVSKGVN